MTGSLSEKLSLHAEEKSSNTHPTLLSTEFEKIVSHQDHWLPLNITEKEGEETNTRELVFVGDPRFVKSIELQPGVADTVNISALIILLT